MAFRAIDWLVELMNLYIKVSIARVHLSQLVEIMDGSDMPGLGGIWWDRLYPHISIDPQTITPYRNVPSNSHINARPLE